MEEKQFLEEFVSYFNEHIKMESPQINSEYNLQRAKFLVVLDDFSQKEIERCYKFLRDELFSQKLSIDYMVPEMVSISSDPGREKRKDKRVSLVIQPISSRKPITVKVENKLKDKEEIEKHKQVLVSHFNQCYKLHKNKPNTYDTFDFTVNIHELADKDTFKDVLQREAKALEYKIYQLKSHLLEIEFINNNYLVRYSYGE